MEFDKNVNYLEDAFWQIIISAGPVLIVALGIGPVSYTHLTLPTSPHV